jgi:hypothetical protein
MSVCSSVVGVLIGMSLDAFAENIDIDGALEEIGNDMDVDAEIEMEADGDVEMEADADAEMGGDQGDYADVGHQEQDATL